MQMMMMMMMMIIDSLVPTAVHVASIWEEDPSFYRLSAQNTIAFSPYTDNLAPLCNITRQKSVTWVFLVLRKVLHRSGGWVVLIALFSLPPELPLLLLPTKLHLSTECSLCPALWISKQNSVVVKPNSICANMAFVSHQKQALGKTLIFVQMHNRVNFACAR